MADQQYESQPQTQQNLIQAQQRMSDFNTMKMRLDTQPLLDQLELFLRGARYTIEQGENGQLITKKLQIGNSLANDVGIQEIMSWASIIINPHTVQGNFPIDKHGYSHTYEKAIYDFRINFCGDLMMNIYEWGIEEEQAMGIIDRVCLFVNNFLSRCIGDKERLSYAKTMESKETQVINPKIPTFKS